MTYEEKCNELFGKLPAEEQDLLIPIRYKYIHGKYTYIISRWSEPKQMDRCYRWVVHICSNDMDDGFHKLLCNEELGFEFEKYNGFESPESAIDCLKNYFKITGK